MAQVERAEAKKTERRLEKQIELAVSTDEVWKLITEPDGLAKWFPLEARVTPGLNGKLFLSWGAGLRR
jgi:uncharacterized protein YndB with AHSA1/START domain